MENPGKGAPLGAATARLMVEADAKLALARIPVGRTGRSPTPKASSCASDDASFMIGAALLVDGGITAQ